MALELLLFPAVAGIALSWKLRPKDPKKGQREVIERVFEQLPVNVKVGSGKNQYIKRPKRVFETEKEWGIVYGYRLPDGVFYRSIAEKIDLDGLMTDTLNRDAELDFSDGLLKIKVFKHRIPTLVPYVPAMLDTCKRYKVVVGVDHTKLIYHDFTQIPHMIIGGMTRYGKSVVMKLLITQLVLVNQSVKFHLFDLKGGLAFNRFKKLPQVRSVSRDVKESLSSLKSIQSVIKKRQKYFEEKGYEDIGEAEEAGEMFGRDIIIVDEASVLAPRDKSDQDRNKIRDILEFIAQVAGGLGFNLIMCSQYPTGDILPRQVKQNSDAKMSFRLGTDIASKVILDEPGAQDIPYGMKGRAIYKTDQKQMIQVPYLTNQQIDDWLAPLKVEIVEDQEGSDDETTGEGREDSQELGEFKVCDDITATEDTSSWQRT